MGTPSPPLVNSRYASGLESPHTVETMFEGGGWGPHCLRPPAGHYVSSQSKTRFKLCGVPNRPVRGREAVGTNLRETAVPGFLSKEGRWAGSFPDGASLRSGRRRSGESPGTLRRSRRPLGGGRGAHSCAPPIPLRPLGAGPASHASSGVDGAGGRHIVRGGNRRGSMRTATCLPARGGSGGFGHPFRGV